MSERRFKESLSWVESIVPKLQSCISPADDNLLLPYNLPLTWMSVRIADPYRFLCIGTHLVQTVIM
jgi:hypothetical protein